MDRTPVVSSNIKSIGYSEEDNVLEVEFINGSVYQYEDVPEEIYTELMEASESGGSVGKLFNRLVKQAEYSYRRVEWIAKRC